MNGYGRPTPNSGMHHIGGSGHGGVPPQGFVAQEEYDHLHRNFRLAAERAESRRVQMLEQEKQVAALRRRITLLEGSDPDFAQAFTTPSIGGTTSAMSIDDYSIGKQSGALERSVNRWAADTVARLVNQGLQRGIDATTSLKPLAQALYDDLGLGDELNDIVAEGERGDEADGLAGNSNDEWKPFLWKLKEKMQWNHPSLKVVVTGLLRHAVGEMFTEGVVNELVVTSKGEANRELTKIHENLFVREPLVAAVWRRQTFSAAVDTIDPALALSILHEHLPKVLVCLSPAPNIPEPTLSALLTSAHVFSRMLHASGRTGSLSSAEGSSFFKAFTPEVGSPLEPGPIELVKRCGRAENSQPERVGCCVFPGLVKVQAVDGGVLDDDGPDTTSGKPITAVGLEHGRNSMIGRMGNKSKRRETRQVVVKRALVICECALELSGIGNMPQQPMAQGGHNIPQQIPGQMGPQRMMTSPLPPIQPQGPMQLFGQQQQQQWNSPPVQMAPMGQMGMMQGQNGMVQGQNGMMQGQNGMMQGQSGMMQGQNVMMQGQNMMSPQQQPVYQQLQQPQQQMLGGKAEPSPQQQQTPLQLM